MRVDHFDFDLPDEAIALRPARPRDSARLLVIRPGDDPQLQDRTVRDLPDLLRPGDALVFNDTRVIPAQRAGRRIGRGATEPQLDVTLHQRVDPSNWKAFVRGARKLQVGDSIRFGGEGRVCLLGMLDAEVTGKGEGGEVTLSFTFHGPILDEAIAALGSLPLPPYISAKREVDEADRADYQTMFAREDGAVAAPTAGLHFTPELLARIEAAGVSAHSVTLHVGAGTFLPVKSAHTAGHRMHSEWGRVTAAVAESLNRTRAAGGRVVAVGTTTLRILESATGQGGRVEAFEGDTSIFITPGYRFQAVDALMTNFHLPRSTLFMLVCAFSGLETMRAAYAHGVASSYRFYSYGDACLLFPSSFRRGETGPGTHDRAQAVDRGRR